MYSPDRPDALQGRTRSHARHSSGSFDSDEWGMKKSDHTLDITQDTTQEANHVEEEAGTVPIATSTTDTDTNTIENINLATAAFPTPATDTTITDTTTNQTEVDLGEKFGEGEGEGGGWLGVMGRHSARKKKAHNNKAAQQVLLLFLLFLNTRVHTDLCTWFAHF